MEKPYPWVLLTTYLFSTILILQASALTNPSNVTVLRDLYNSLNQPPQLVGWKFSGGDHIDVNFNHIDGEIPSSLPPNATHMDLSFNSFNQNIPFSLTSMKYLRHLNLSHNSLSWPVGNVFMGLPNPKQMVLTYNNFNGDLPSSFTSLTNLTGLFLQNNQFKGSVVFLAYLPLTDLNIQNNHFSGVVPKQFENIPNLWLGENAFQVGADYSPWSFPTDNIPTDQNVEYFPKAQSNAIGSCPISREGKQKQNRSTPGAITFTVGVIALVATCATALLAIQIKRSHRGKLENSESNHNGYHSPLSTATVIESSYAESEEHLSLMMVAYPPVPRLNQTKEFNGIRQSRNQSVSKVLWVSMFPITPGGSGSIKNATFQSMRRLRQAAGCNWRDWKAVGIKAEGRPPLQPVQKSEVYYKCSGCRSEIVKYTAVTFINEIHGLRFQSPSLQVDPLETVHAGAYADTLLSPAVGFIPIFHLQCNCCQQQLGHLYRAPNNNETWVLTRHLLRLQ